MPVRTPTSPLSAHHRLMVTMVKTSHRKAKVSPTPEALDRVSRVFQRAGGSWERLYLGSSEDMTLLKRTLKVAVKSGVFTKSPSWS